MQLLKLVLKNQVFHRGKILAVVLLVSFMFFVPAASLLLTDHIRRLADKPLQSLQSELILQKNAGDKDAAAVTTRGVMVPFNLHSFSKPRAAARLARIGEIKKYSVALVLWQFDVKNNRTIVALDKNDPAVGLRKIESFLMPGGRFFASNTADEVILERHFSRLFGYRLHGDFPLGGRHLQIVGIVDFQQQSNLSNASIFIPYAVGLAFIKAPHPITNQVYLSLGSSADIGTVRKKAAALFPGYALISKDSLVKNLSGFNQLIYRSGRYFVLAVIPLCLLLAFWILRIYRMEFRDQTVILKILGWPRRWILQWLACDIGMIVLGALALAAVLTMVLQWEVIPRLQLAPMLDQGFQL